MKLNNRFWMIVTLILSVNAIANEKCEPIINSIPLNQMVPISFRSPAGVVTTYSPQDLINMANRIPVFEWYWEMGSIGTTNLIQNS